MDDDRKNLPVTEKKPDDEPTPAKKALAIVAAFGLVVAVDMYEDDSADQQEIAAEQRLTDDNGVEYTLIDNGDGTETAKYDNGDSVTFKRQEDGSLDYLAGTAGLIAGMAAGYYLFHGYQNTGNLGKWDAAKNRYAVSEPLKLSDRNNAVGGGGYVGSKNNASSAKSGFGSAGARGGAS